MGCRHLVDIKATAVENCDAMIGDDLLESGRNIVSVEPDFFLEFNFETGVLAIVAVFFYVIFDGFDDLSQILAISMLTVA